MRIEDVFNYREPVMEAPYSAFQKVKDTVGSKFGSTEATGNKEAGTLANQIYSEFRGYVGRVAGRGQKFIDAKHLMDFLQHKGLNSQFGKQPTDKITPDQAQQIIMKAVRANMQHQAADAKPSAKQAAPQSTSSNELSQQISQLTPEERSALQKLLA